MVAPMSSISAAASIPHCDFAHPEMRSGTVTETNSVIGGMLSHTADFGPVPTSIANKTGGPVSISETSKTVGHASSLSEAIHRATAEFAVLKEKGASPAQIAEHEMRIEGLNSLAAREKVGEYARKTGRHILPHHLGLDLPRIASDYRAPADVRAAASQVLKFEKHLAKTNPAIAAHQTLSKYAADTDKHILPNHQGMDLVGAKNDNTASKTVRDAANYLLQNTHFGHTGLAGPVGAGAALAISLPEAIQRATAELAVLKEKGASPAQIAVREMQIEGLNCIGAREKVGEYARKTGQHILPHHLGLDLPRIASDYHAPADVRAAASQVLKFEEHLAKTNPFFGAHQTLVRYAAETGQHILPNGGLDLPRIRCDFTASKAVRDAANYLFLNSARAAVVPNDPANAVGSKPVAPAPLSKPITVSTFNTRYDQGAAAVDTLNRIAPHNDILLLQEVKNNAMMSITSNLFGSHAPYLGETHNHDWQGEYEPIFYNKKRFEAVYTDHIQLNEAGDLGAGSPRHANFVLLKDRQTGATVLVSNTHLDNWSDASQQSGIEKIKAKIASIKAQYPVDSVISGGDFNRDPNSAASTLGLQGANYSFNSLPTLRDGGNADGILVSGRDAGTAASGFKVTDGGASDHNIVSRSVQVTAHDDPRKAALKPANPGAIVYDAANYDGDGWIIGFGTNGPINTQWNDHISSVRVGDDTTLTASSHSPRDPAYLTPQNVTTQLKGSVPWVGAAVNDTFSGLSVTAAPAV